MQVAAGVAQALTLVSVSGIARATAVEVAREIATTPIVQLENTGAIPGRPPRDCLQTPAKNAG